LVSATLTHKIEVLAQQLMKNEQRVGFDANVDEKELDLSKIIPHSIS